MTGDAVDKTELTNKEIECNILSSNIINDKQIRLSFYFKNTDAKRPFYFREIGLFAIDPDTSEKVLYAYTNAGTEAEYINNSSTINNTKTIDIDVVIDNASEITVELAQPSPYATKDDMNQFKKQIEMQQLEYTPRYETIILNVNNWVQNETTQNYEYSITDNKITANHLVEGYPDLENQKRLSNGYTESFDGGYKIITSELPTENITMNISIQKVISNTENTEEGGEQI